MHQISLNKNSIFQTKSYSTRYSQAVPHLSTNHANTSLTAEIGRDPVWSGVYGHNWNRWQVNETSINWIALLLWRDLIWTWMDFVIFKQMNGRDRKKSRWNCLGVKAPSNPSFPVFAPCRLNSECSTPKINWIFDYSILLNHKKITRIIQNGKQLMTRRNPTPNAPDLAQ